MVVTTADLDHRVGAAVGGKYRLVRVVGVGGMGTVYEAVHTVIGQRVALKFLRPEHAGDRESLARFMREAQTAATASSDHIVGIVDVGTAEDGAPYIVMEYLDGESVASRLAREDPMPLGEVLPIIVQVCRAIDAAHKKGVIHCDLKPDNVILLRKGARRDFVKLLDFGVSKFVQGGGPRLTQPGVIVGTPAYMAPEQVRGKRDIDHRADIYSIGTLLYRMTTGSLPYEEDSFYALIVAVATTRPPRPRERRPDLPVALERIVLRAMEPDRKKRYSSAADLAQALIEFSEADRALSEAVSSADRDEYTPLTPAPASVRRPEDELDEAATMIRVPAESSAPAAGPSSTGAEAALPEGTPTTTRRPDARVLLSSDPVPVRIAASRSSVFRRSGTWVAVSAAVAVALVLVLGAMPQHETTSGERGTSLSLTPAASPPPAATVRAVLPSAPGPRARLDPAPVVPRRSAARPARAAPAEAREGQRPEARAEPRAPAARRPALSARPPVPGAGPRPTAPAPPTAPTTSPASIERYGERVE